MLVPVSKALTGGTLPLAATVASRSVYDAFLSDDSSRAFMHGPTYAGNAMATVQSSDKIKVIDIMLVALNLA